MPVSARRLEAKDRGATPLAQCVFWCSNLDRVILILLPPTVRETRLFFNSEIEQLVKRTHQDAKQSQPAAAAFLPNYAIHIVIENQHKEKTGAFQCQRQS